MYAATHMKCDIIKGCFLFYHVCSIFNHATQHTKHIKRALTSYPRLRFSLSKWTFLPDRQPAITTTSTILTTLRSQTAQNIAPILRTLCDQYIHLYRTRSPNDDPDRYNPQSSLTHALQNVVRTLNIPSSQRSLANPLPTTAQQCQRYSRAATICSCPPRFDTTRTPRMCENYDFLRSYVHRTLPTPVPNIICGACDMHNDTIPPHQACTGCIASMYSSARTRFYCGGMIFRLQHHRCPHCRYTDQYITQHPFPILCPLLSVGERPHYPHYYLNTFINHT